METVPLLDVPLPIPVVALHQLELTSRCNLRCPYCVSPNLARPKVDMTRETFSRALEHVRVSSRRGLQGELNLAGIGESTLHPDLVEFTGLAREACGPDVILTITTNGVAVTEEQVKGTKPFNLRWFVSLHRPEKAKAAIDLCRKYDCLEGFGADAATGAIDWAGQVDWVVTAPKVRPCPWLRGGRAFVFADGRVSSCCLDASGAGVIGHVDDPVGSLKTQPYALCPKCDQQVGIKGYDQQQGRFRVIS